MGTRARSEDRDKGMKIKRQAEGGVEVSTEVRRHGVGMSGAAGMSITEA